jgi:UDP-N-acetylenolpyruvoylglucosamine reductase
MMRLLTCSYEIKSKVLKKFKIEIEIEPEIISS